MGATSTALPEGRAGSTGPIRTLGMIDCLTFIGKVNLSNSYATGGDTLTLPTKVKGMDLKQVYIANDKDATRYYVWDGSTSAPKIKAITAATAAEVAATTDLSAVLLHLLLVYEG